MDGQEETGELLFAENRAHVWLINFLSFLWSAGKAISGASRSDGARGESGTGVHERRHHRQGGEGEGDMDAQEDR